MAFWWVLLTRGNFSSILFFKIKTAFVFFLEASHLILSTNNKKAPKQSKRAEKFQSTRIETYYNHNLALIVAIAQVIKLSAGCMNTACLTGRKCVFERISFCPQRQIIKAAFTAAITMKRWGDCIRARHSDYSKVFVSVFVHAIAQHAFVKRRISYISPFAL